MTQDQFLSVGPVIPLRSKILRSSLGELGEDRVLRVSRNPDRPTALRRSEIFILDSNDVPAGFLGYMVFDQHFDETIHRDLPVVVVSSDLAYLTDGDVIRISEKKLRVRVLFRSSARQNGLLLTERCNHYCLMCSQPPKDHDDSYLIDEIEEVLRLAPPGESEICFTGGEPTLLGDRFIRLVRLAKNFMPASSLHVLSNGRAFEDEAFAKKLGDVAHHDLMLGVPIYSDAPEIHNYVVQAENALDGTIRGVVNLNRHHVPVELRIDPREEVGEGDVAVDLRQLPLQLRGPENEVALECQTKTVVEAQHSVLGKERGGVPRLSRGQRGDVVLSGLGVA